MRVLAKTITRQLFFTLGILATGIIIIAILSTFFLWKTRAAHQISQQIDNQRILITQLIKTDLEFLRFETLNQEYFRTSNSSLLKERDSLARAIKSNHRALHHKMYLHNFLTEAQFRQIDSAIQQYNTTFALLTTKINERGFKDYGLEGKMRNYAHRLETAKSSLALTSLLSLRRHEKDFLLRKEKIYVDKFNELTDKLLRVLHPSDSTVYYLVTYREAFNELSRLDIEIGIDPSEGLLGQLNRQTNFISQKLNALTVISNERAEELVKGSTLYFAIISIVIILACVALTYITSMRLVRPIKKLSSSIGKFIVNEGLNEQELESSEFTDEISNLSQSFIKLTRKLKAQFNEIQQKSDLLERQNKELKKLNAELDRFIYSAAHDLKSPLTSLDGLVRLAEKDIGSTSHEHYFKMMLASIHKLYGFILDITDYAKNKRQTLKVEKIDLKKSLDEIISSLKFLPAASGVSTHVKISGNELYSDKTRLEIVLKNIISNSFHYMDMMKDNPYIHVECLINENYARIQIADNGIGIDEQHLPKIFDMFYRAVEQSKGTGIGLFLVKESLKMLRGKISVKSKLGEFTTFYIIVPNLTSMQVNTPETEAVVLEDLV